MITPLEQKTSIDEIKAGFDNDVERFSNLDTGQTATIDAPLAMELIAQAAFKSTANIQKVLDIGCGSGASLSRLRAFHRYHGFDTAPATRARLRTRFPDPNVQVHRGEVGASDLAAILPTRS